MKLNKDNIFKVLDPLYNSALVGLPKTSSVYEFADEYLGASDGNVEQAIDSLIRYQSAKNTVTGFVSGLGGVITLPIAVPFELTALLYIQIRMIATIAHLSGFDPKSDQVKTLVYCALVGDSVNEILKQAGIEVGKKLTKRIISSISRDTLVAINKIVGFRLITKFGEKGIINLGKLMPIVGGIISGSMDGYSCYQAGKTAKNLFYTTTQST